MVETTWIVQVTVPAKQPANSLLPASIVIDPQKGPEASFTVPKGQMVVVKDIYVSKAPTADGLLIVKRNEFQEVLRTDVVSSLIVTNPAKPKYKELVFTEGDRISFQYLNTAAGGDTDETVTIYVKVEILPMPVQPQHFVANATGVQPAAMGIKARLRWALLGR